MKKVETRLSALLLAGKTHPLSQCFIPYQLFFFWEGSKPCWTTGSIVKPPPEVSSNFSSSPPEIWLPSPHYPLEDGIIMAAATFRRVDIVAALDNFLPGWEKNPHRLCDLSPHGREKLRLLARQMEGIKLCLVVFVNSSLGNQLNILSHYRLEVEVCTPSFVRDYSLWQNDLICRGTLEKE
ncbi:MAG: hypothetical protein PWQ91_1001 [Eubacteriales bacterium]|nr:hypothetical protein [Eubacteriales bacterium]